MYFTVLYSIPKALYYTIFLHRSYQGTHTKKKETERIHKCVKPTTFIIYKHLSIVISPIKIWFIVVVPHIDDNRKKNLSHSFKNVDIIVRVLYIFYFFLKMHFIEKYAFSCRYLCRYLCIWKIAILIGKYYSRWYLHCRGKENCNRTKHVCCCVKICTTSHLGTHDKK